MSRQGSDSARCRTQWVLDTVRIIISSESETVLYVRIIKFGGEKM